MKKFVTTTILLSLTTLFLWAVPARRIVTTYSQPDGSSVSVVLQGDEHFHYYATTDGVMVAKGNDGYFYYANLSEDGTIKPSSILAHNKEDRTITDIDFIKQTDPQTTKQKITRRAAKSPKRIGASKVSEVPQTGTPRIPVILIQYNDVKFSEGDDTNANYTKRISAKGYTGGRDHGSIRDYFIAQSNGKFDPQFDVIGPVTLPNNRAYYGANDSYGDDIRPGEMIQDACNIAKEQGLISDFSIYDNDKDKYVDVVYTIYAGIGENSSDEDNSIWPHQWWLSAAIGEPIAFDNVKIDKYACNNELYENEIDGIGTFCHEFSHCLGLPDFYDTNYNYFGMDAWDLMDHGSYNDNGHTPAGYSSYEREFMGWMNTIPLDNPKSIELKALNSDESVAYKISNENNPNEYFLLENRQQTEWDSALPGHGMLVIHVNYDEDLWNSNQVNNYAQQCMTLVPADKLLISEPISLQSDPYPGLRSVTSIPSLKVYTGPVIEKPITNIAENDGIITFDFMEGMLETPIALSATDITATGFTANWEAVEDAESYTLEIKKIQSGELLLSEDFSGFKDGSVESPSSIDISTKLDTYMQTKGWTGSKIFQAGGVCKMASNKQPGNLTTPALDLSASSGTVTISMKAQGKVAGELKVSLFGSPAASSATSEQTIHITTAEQEISCTLESNLDTGYITISTTSGKVVFIDDITVYGGENISKTKAAGNDMEPITIPGTETSYQVTDLEPSSTYKYTVKAHAGNKESAYSNSIKVNLAPSSIKGCTLTKAYNSIYTDVNDIVIVATKNATANIYSIDGILKQSVMIEQGDNRIEMPNGIYIIRIGDSSTKVVLSAK